MAQFLSLPEAIEESLRDGDTVAMTHTIVPPPIEGRGVAARLTRTAVDWARAEGRPAIVATFDPHPVRFFRPDTPPFRLTTLEQRHELYLAAGATAMLVYIAVG